MIPSAGSQSRPEWACEGPPTEGLRGRAIPRAVDGATLVADGLYGTVSFEDGAGFLLVDVERQWVDGQDRVGFG